MAIEIPKYQSIKPKDLMVPIIGLRDRPDTRDNENALDIARNIEIFYESNLSYIRERPALKDISTLTTLNSNSGFEQYYESMIFIAGDGDEWIIIHIDNRILAHKLNDVSVLNVIVSDFKTSYGSLEADEKPTMIQRDNDIYYFNSKANLVIHHGESSDSWSAFKMNIPKPEGPKGEAPFTVSALGTPAGGLANTKGRHRFKLAYGIWNKVKEEWVVQSARSKFVEHDSADAGEVVGFDLSALTCDHELFDDAGSHADLEARIIILSSLRSDLTDEQKTDVEEEEKTKTQDEEFIYDTSQFFEQTSVIYVIKDTDRLETADTDVHFRLNRDDILSGDPFAAVAVKAVTGSCGATGGSKIITYTSGNTFDNVLPGEIVKIDSVEYEVDTINYNGTTDKLEITLKTAYAASTGAKDFDMDRASGIYRIFQQDEVEFLKETQPGSGVRFSISRIPLPNGPLAAYHKGRFYVNDASRRDLQSKVFFGALSTKKYLGLMYDSVKDFVNIRENNRKVSAISAFNQDLLYSKEGSTLINYQGDVENSDEQELDTEVGFEGRTLAQRRGDGIALTTRNELRAVSSQGISGFDLLDGISFNKNTKYIQSFSFWNDDKYFLALKSSQNVLTRFLVFKKYEQIQAIGTHDWTFSKGLIPLKLFIYKDELHCLFYKRDIDTASFPEPDYIWEFNGRANTGSAADNIKYQDQKKGAEFSMLIGNAGDGISGSGILKATDEATSGNDTLITFNEKVLPIISLNSKASFYWRIKFTADITGDQEFFISYDPSATRRFDFDWLESGGTVTFRVRLLDDDHTITTPVSFTKSKASIEDVEIDFLLVKDGKNLYLYMNGILESSSTGGYKLTYEFGSKDSPQMLGSTGPDAGWELNKMYIWDGTALSADQALDLKNAPVDYNAGKLFLKKLVDAETGNPEESYSVVFRYPAIKGVRRKHDNEVKRHIVYLEHKQPVNVKLFLDDDRDTVSAVLKPDYYEDEGIEYKEANYQLTDISKDLPIIAKYIQAQYSTEIGAGKKLLYRGHSLDIEEIKREQIGEAFHSNWWNESFINFINSCSSLEAVYTSANSFTAGTTKGDGCWSLFWDRRIFQNLIYYIKYIASASVELKKVTLDSSGDITATSTEETFTAPGSPGSGHAPAIHINFEKTILMIFVGDVTNIFNSVINIGSLDSDGEFTKQREDLSVKTICEAAGMVFTNVAIAVGCDSMVIMDMLGWIDENHFLAMVREQTKEQYYVSFEINTEDYGITVKSFIRNDSDANFHGYGWAASAGKNSAQQPVGRLSPSGRICFFPHDDGSFFPSKRWITINPDYSLIRSTAHPSGIASTDTIVDVIWSYDGLYMYVLRATDVSAPYTDPFTLDAYLDNKDGTFTLKSSTVLTGIADKDFTNMFIHGKLIIIYSTTSIGSTADSFTEFVCVDNDSVTPMKVLDDADSLEIVAWMSDNAQLVGFGDGAQTVLYTLKQIGDLASC